MFCSRRTHHERDPKFRETPRAISEFHDVPRAAGGIHDHTECGRSTLMDFIEHLFGVSPDGGNGSFEIVLIVFLTTLAMTVMMAFTRMMPPIR